MTTQTRNPVPMIAIVLIAVATVLLWLGALALLTALTLGSASSGGFLPSMGVGSGMQAALLIQWGVSGLGYLGAMLLGTVVLVAQAQGGSDGAARAARLLVRFLIVITVLQVLAGMALPLSVGGVVMAITAVARGLPMALVTIAALICADRYLSAARDRDDIFA